MPKLEIARLKLDDENTNLELLYEIKLMININQKYEKQLMSFLLNS